MTFKKIWGWIASNWLFALIIGFTAFFVLLVTNVIFPCIVVTENAGLEATILGILVSIFVLYFIIIQIIYIVSDLPTKILRKYTIFTKESIVFIAYFLLVITATTLIAIDIIVLPSKLFAISCVMLLSLILTVFYFIWFNTRITAKGILQEISKRTEKSFKKINEFEELCVNNFKKFHKFLAQQEQFSYDPGYYLFFPTRHPHYTLVIQEECSIRYIDIPNIYKTLQEAMEDNHVKVRFEVEPTMLLPNKSLFEPRLRNFRICTLAYEKISDNENAGDYRNKQKEFIKKFGSEFDLTDNRDDEITIRTGVENTLKSIGDKLLPYFHKESYKKWTTNADEALGDFKEMILLTIKREESLHNFCALLHVIINDQLFSIKPEVYLYLKEWAFNKLINDINYVNEIAVKKSNTEFFDKVLETFYALAYKKAREAKNSRIYESIFEAINYFQSTFLMSGGQPYNPRVQILILHLSELIKYDFHKDFEKDAEESALDSFYEPVIKKAIDVGFWIIKRNVDWYCQNPVHIKKYLKEQVQDYINLLDFYRDHPEDYIEKSVDYFKVKFALERGETVAKSQVSSYNLANKKAVLVKEISHMHRFKIITLVCWILHKFMKEEVPAELVWKIAMPTAKACSNKWGYTENLTKLFNDREWQGEANTRLFWRDAIYPPGAHTPVGFDYNTFWILFNIYLRDTNLFFPTKTTEFLKEELLKAFSLVEPDFWAEALNIETEKFRDQKEIYKAFVSKIKVTNNETP